MKTLTVLTSAAATFIAMISTSLAQDNKPDAGARGRALSPEARLEQMKERLNLTPEQVEKIKPIFEKSKVKGDELRANTSLTQEQRREQGRELIKAMMEEINPILTPEQQAKAKEEMQKRRAELESRQK